MDNACPAKVGLDHRVPLLKLGQVAAVALSNGAAAHWADVQDAQDPPRHLLVVVVAWLGTQTHEVAVHHQRLVAGVPVRAGVKRVAPVGVIVRAIHKGVLALQAQWAQVVDEVVDVAPRHEVMDVYQLLDVRLIVRADDELVEGHRGQQSPRLCCTDCRRHGLIVIVAVVVVVTRHCWKGRTERSRKERSEGRKGFHRSPIASLLPSGPSIFAERRLYTHR